MEIEKSGQKSEFKRPQKYQEMRRVIQDLKEKNQKEKEQRKNLKLQMTTMTSQLLLGSEREVKLKNSLQKAIQKNKD